MKFWFIQNENQLIRVPNEVYETVRDKETEPPNCLKKGYSFKYFFLGALWCCTNSTILIGTAHNFGLCYVSVKKTLGRQRIKLLSLSSSLYKATSSFLMCFFLFPRVSIFKFYFHLWSVKHFNYFVLYSCWISNIAGDKLVL